MDVYERVQPQDMMNNAVIVASQEFKVLCRVPIDEGFTAASPAIANGNVYFRTAKHLFCVGK